MTCSRQTRGHGFLPCVVSSRCVVVSGGALLGDAKPPGLNICGCIDRLDTYVIEFHKEHITFSRMCLHYVRIITVCLRVSLVELPFQIVMGRIPALECMLSGAHGLCQSCPISLGSERFHPLRP
jgi:hypothetical protein